MKLCVSFFLEIPNLIHNNICIHLGGWLEDAWCAASNAELKALQQPSLLQINPSYGVSPSESTAEMVEETKTNTTEATVYVYMDEAETAVSNSKAAMHTYVNDPKHNTDVVEEYEYISLSPSPTEQLLAPQNMYKFHYF